MIVDTSALIAILHDEPDAAAFARIMVETAAPLAMPAGSYLETAIVADRARDPVVSRRLDQLIAMLGIEILPVTPEQAMLARDAYRDFGRGSGHPAQLNFGDCFAYALARETNRPLLFKGDDFAATDLTPARG